MTEIITKKYLINGPINVIRLTNGIKVLYIFGDYHLAPDWQSECPINDKYETMDIDKFISLFIKTEKTKHFDLFAEMYPKYFNEQQYPQRGKYIHNFMKLFQAKLKKSDNEVKINTMYPNFRFHFMDIRGTIPLFEPIFYFFKNFDHSNNITYSKIRFHLFEHIQNLEEIINYLKSKSNRYIDKLKNKYSNKDIKDKINKLYEELITNLINLKQISVETYNALKEHFKTNDKLNELLNKNMLFIENHSMDIMVVLTDLYFIRRFLDKKYIMNSILYTGNFHLCNITYLLVKYFDFQITNVYYYNNIINPDPKKLENKVLSLKSHNYNYIVELDKDLKQHINNMSKSTISPAIAPLPKETVYQCVNLMKFPDNFS